MQANSESISVKVLMNKCTYSNFGGERVIYSSELKTKSMIYISNKSIVLAYVKYYILNKWPVFINMYINYNMLYSIAYS